MVTEAKPKPVKKVPAVQFWHVATAMAAEAVEYKPALQGTHVEEAEAPVPPK